MRLVGLKIDPSLRTPYNEEQQCEGWFSRRNYLEVGTAEVLFMETAGQVTFFASSGSQPERVDATKCRACLYGMREFDLRMDWVDILFSGGVAGTMSFWTRARWQASSKEFKLNKSLSEKAFTEFLARKVESALAPILESALAGFSYEPLCNLLLGDYLANCKGDMQQALLQHCGLLLPTTLRVASVRAPSIDGKARQEEIQHLQDEQRRREAKEAINIITTKSTVNQVLYAENLNKRKAQLEQERVELEISRQREEVRTAIELTRERAHQEKRRLRAEAELKETEAEAARKCIRNTDEQISQMNAFTKQIADTICARTDALEYQIANLESVIAQNRETSEPSLALVADWRAHGRSGILIPRLGANEKLPTGTLLDVAVTTNRDAYVYILLQDSAGVWVSLIPELPGNPIMGVTHSNLQRTGEVVVWPDANNLYPDSPPQWQLQPPTGFERLIVLASEMEVDMTQIFHENRLNGLLEKAKPISRSLGNPGKTGTALSHEAQDYSRVMTVLRGIGSVYQETVIEHLSS